MQIAIPLFNQVTALEAVGPYEILPRLPGATAGLLDGLSAATHWSAYEALRKLGAEPTGDRVVEHLGHRLITAAGVSSGIDMALRCWQRCDAGSVAMLDAVSFNSHGHLRREGDIADECADERHVGW
ncbi:MAG: transcriptional regulator GlxA family with amidase domain [Acidimicrobiales bacterium]|jgi:transcriptional regulator GlxA family with amidase domain